MQLESETMRQRRSGRRPRIELRKSVAARPANRTEIWWATDIATVHCEMGGWCTFVPVIDCCTRQVLGWEHARTAKARTAERALENALLARFGHCRTAQDSLVVRHDNSIVFGRAGTSRPTRQSSTASAIASSERSSRSSSGTAASARSRTPAGRSRRGSASRTGRARTRD